MEHTTDNQQITKTLDDALSNQQLSQSAHDNIMSWLRNNQLTEFHQQITELVEKKDWSELENAFFNQVEFGTAGIRGKTGLGSARINRWTIGIAAQGLADYISSLGDEAKNKGVVVGSDTRLTSPEFVELVTHVMVSNGIKVYQFSAPRQVGMFSFAVRLYKAQAGAYISASHNPPTDNGFKCYWEDGAQVLPPHDKAIISAVKNVIKIETTENGEVNQDLITKIDEQFDSLYIARVLEESVAQTRSAKVVYSPFHGTGQYGVLPVLKAAGFEVELVEEQMKPDGNFPNVPGGVPNPQNRESNAKTAELVLTHQADLGISTDPDADRLGIVIPKDDTTVILDGNQTAALLAYFICSRLKEADALPSNGFLVRTLVTTPVIDAIAHDFGLKAYGDIPVGFKYIGELIREKEDFGSELFIFGGEESFGCLKGSYSRDKDASVAALMACEMVSWLKDRNQTVWDLLDEMSAKYGFYLNEAIDVKFEGAKGFTSMTNLMKNLRANPPEKVGEYKVIQSIDRLTNEIKDSSGMIVKKNQGLETNVFQLVLGDSGEITATIRPSGTEAKIKFYLAIRTQLEDITQLKSIEKNTTEKANGLLTALKDLALQLAG